MTIQEAVERAKAYFEAQEAQALADHVCEVCQEPIDAPGFCARCAAALPD